MSERTTDRIYGVADTTLNVINKNFISLQDEERKTCVEHFKQVLEKIIFEMKQQDTLFNAIYQRICGAGSYFDGLRVAKANEFDMDVVVNLPVNYNEMIIENDDVPPAFVKVKITKALDKLRQHPRWSSDYRGLDNWRNSDGYLLQTKFRTWMEGVVNKALNTFPKAEAGRFELVLTKSGPGGNEEVKYTVSLKKSGPAMTLNISMPGELPNVDVDLVPVIEFKHPQWPPKHVRLLDKPMAKKRPAWFIVPKPKTSSSFKDYYWRLAFHDQEREMLHDKASLKPICRLLKKFRDVRSMSLIASYYIKTLFLWEVQTNSDPLFWQQSVTKLFFYMLEKFHQSLKDGHIFYFWDSRYNLLEAMTADHFKNDCGKLANALKKINKRLIDDPENSDPTVLAEYLLTKSELDRFYSLQGSVGERSPPRVLTRSNTDGVPNEVQAQNEVRVQNEVHNNGPANATNELLLQEMKKMMNQMQETALQTNAIVVKIFKRIEELEYKIESQHAKIMDLEGKLNSLNQSEVPFTLGQQGVKDFLTCNHLH